MGGTERSAHTKITVTRTKVYAVSEIISHIDLCAPKYGRVRTGVLLSFNMVKNTNANYYKPFISVCQVLF